MTLWARGLMGITSKGRNWCDTRVEKRLRVEVEKEGTQNDMRRGVDMQNVKGGGAQREP